MTLQTKVTLGSVLLATFIVTLVSGVDVGSFMELQLQATLERAAVIKDVAKDAVIETLNRRRDVPLRDALRDPDLKQQTAEPARLAQRRPFDRHCFGGEQRGAGQHPGEPRRHQVQRT